MSNRPPSLRELTLPLYSKEGSGTSWFRVLVCGLHTRGMDLAFVTYREDTIELQLPRDIAAITWHLTVTGCLLWHGLPQVNLSRGFLGWEGASAWGANEWALEPTSPGIGEVACPIVYCMTLSEWPTMPRAR